MPLPALSSPLSYVQYNATFGDNRGTRNNSVVFLRCLTDVQICVGF